MARITVAGVSMREYVLRMRHGCEPLDPQLLMREGERTRLIYGHDGEALLFSSPKSAEAAISKYGLFSVDIERPDMALGEFLATAGDLDLCSEATIDGKERVMFMSCAFGHYILPSHFYRWVDGGFQVLQNDDDWHEVNIKLEIPRCACGADLGQYVPSGLQFANNKILPGIYQIVAGGHTALDGTGCSSLVRIDMVLPEKNLTLEVLLHADRETVILTYDLTPDGMIHRAPGEGHFEKWAVCPLSGLVSIGISPIETRTELEKVIVRKAGQNGTLIYAKPPSIQYEHIPAAAARALYSLCPTGLGYV
jgi:hypothetical protein